MFLNDNQTRWIDVAFGAKIKKEYLIQYLRVTLAPQNLFYALEPEKYFF